jgi:putative NIF3 family GTP cyclohydrolase 1 type 2
MFMQAIQLGIDCYITGEVNEQVMALAEESGVSYIAGGHHVTERYGIKALSNHMSSYLPCDYVEFYNPI